ncbi:MAG: energy transducer TonB, partial [Pseudomonadota bacterium]
REQAPGNVVADAGLARIATAMVSRADAHLVGEEFLELDDAMRVIERIEPTHPELTRLREDIAGVIEQKLAAADGAVRRGQWVPAQALYDQLALIPGVDELQLIEREDALVAAQAAAETAAEEAAAQAAQAEAQAAAAGEAETAPADETPAEAAPEEAAETLVDDLFAAVIQRLDADQLLSPAGQSARDAFNALARAAPDDPTVGAARRRLVGALADRAVLLGNSNQFVEASRFLDAAELLDADNPRVNSSRDAVIDRQADLEGQRIIPVGELVNTRVVRPRYPSRALRNDAEGYVVLNFTVQSDGSTTDIEAIEVSDRYSEQFERAAIAAVTQWQFEPRQYLGRTIDQRVEARVTFELEP